MSSNPGKSSRKVTPNLIPSKGFRRSGNTEVMKLLNVTVKEFVLII